MVLRHRMEMLLVYLCLKINQEKLNNPKFPFGHGYIVEYFTGISLENSDLSMIFCNLNKEEDSKIFFISYL